MDGDQISDDAYIGYVGIASIEGGNKLETKDSADELVQDLLDERDTAKSDVADSEDSLVLEMEQKEKQQLRAVTRLQVAFRKQRTLKMEKKAATKLQSAFRRSQSFKRVEKMKSEKAEADAKIAAQQQAAVTIQARWKKKKTIDLGNLEKRAALVIQTTWRNKRTGSIIKEMAQEVDVDEVCASPQKTAALAIQNAWRARQRAKEVALEDKMNVQIKLRKKELPINKPMWALTPSNSERAPSIAASLEHDRLCHVNAEAQIKESMKRTENIVKSMIDSASANQLKAVVSSCQPMTLSPPAKMQENDESERVMVSPTKTTSFPLVFANNDTFERGCSPGMPPTPCSPVRREIADVRIMVRKYHRLPTKLL